MTIAFSHYSAPNDVGGVTTWLEKLLLRLHADGIPLAVLLHHYGFDVRRSSLLKPLRSAGIAVEIVSREDSLAGDVRQTLAFLNRYKPSVFIPNCLNSMYFAAGIAGSQGLPWVLTIHSDAPDYWAIVDAVPPQRSGGITVCVSRHIHSLARERCLPGVPELIPYGVRLPDREAKYCATPFWLAYSGRIVDVQKRISLVMQTMALACRREPRLHGVVMGTGTELRNITAWVAQQGLADRITFTGRLTPQQVQMELSRCQALLLMSDFEGLPIVLLEAMALGVVPVVRQIPSGIPELVHDRVTGLVVDNNPESTADAIISLARDEALWRTCSQGARTLIRENYADEDSYRKWRSVLERLERTSVASYPLEIPARLNVPSDHPLLGRGYPANPPYLGAKRCLIRMKNALMRCSR